MEASGPISQEAHQLLNTELARLFDDAGPFVSVYLDVSAAQERAHDRAELHWKNVRRDLGEAGVDESTLHLLDEEVQRGAGDGDTLALIAGAGGVLHSSFQPDPPIRDVGRFGPLPSIAPLLEWRQSMPTHIVVTADRVGADIVAFVRDGRDVEVHMDGDDDVVHKSGKGGWSQRRYEQRTENTWEANAGAVAERLIRLVDRLNPRLIVGAGDGRALQLLTQDLPERVSERFVITDGSRAEDSSGDALSTGAVRLVATKVAEDTVALLEKFREERGQGDRAADGIARTVDALTQARVETLLLHDAIDDDRTLWFGPEAVHIATNAQALRDLGVDNPVEWRLADVLLRAAAGTGTGVWIIPKSGGPKGGVGAILRW